MEEELDITKLRYVLYARKSRTDEFAQVRSIPDQIDECQKLARSLNLNIVAILREEQSAKKPNQRPVFNQMIADIKAGKYDAILSWNPDRLARNMLEGGQIIDMIDMNVIKDLKFATHHFTKDANGKMLLGMAFVLSKQYSDKLSQDVKRGVGHRLTKEGKTPIPKYGYINEDGLYDPDIEEKEDGHTNFSLMCEAWQMRKSGTSLQKIADYLNENDFHRVVKSTGEKLYVDIQKLSDIFKDSFYYGLLVQAKQQIDLREFYDFKPAVSEEDYNIVQSLSYRRIKPSKPHKLAFYPLRLMVKCYFCGDNMVVGPSTSHTGKRYLNYRCDNKACIRNSPENRSKKWNDPSRIKGSIRAKVIFDFIYAFLADGLNFTEADYKRYYEGISGIMGVKREKIQLELNSKRGALKAVKREIEELSLALLKHDKVSTIYKSGENKVKALESKQIEVEADITKLEGQLTDPEQDKLTLEQFLNLSKNAVRLAKSDIPEVKDTICRKIFLNLTVDSEKVASYQLKPPFDELLKTRHQLPSRRRGN